MSTFFEQTARRFLNKNNRLLQLERIINWEALRGILKRPRGLGGQEPYDELAMTKALILQAWFGLSDNELEVAIGTRMDFIVFCGFERLAASSVPDATTFCRFRNYLITEGLEAKILDYVNDNLAKHGLKIKQSKGALIDATIIDCAARPTKSIEVRQDGVEVEHSADPDATYTIKRNQPRLGYKCFARCDEEGFIEKINTLPANQAEVTNLEPLLKGMPKGQRCCADKGFDSANNRQLLKKYNLKDGIQRRTMKNQQINRKNILRNKIIAKTRFKIEQVFGTLKRKFSFRRAAYFGTTKVQGQFTIKAICSNLLKAVNKLQIASTSPPLLQA